MLNVFFSWFERRINPYPKTVDAVTDQGFFAFIHSCLYGLRRYLLLVVILTAGLGVFEAYLFDQENRWPQRLLEGDDGLILVDWGEQQQHWRVQFRQEQHSGFQSCRDIPEKKGSWTSLAIVKAEKIS